MAAPSTAIDAKPRAGCWFFVLPALLTVGVIVAYAILFALGVVGRAATGDRVAMPFMGCPDARPIVEKRVAAMGLGDPVVVDVDGGFVVTATLPDNRAAEGIPTTLATPAEMVLKTEDETLVLATNADVADAAVSLEHLGTPLTIVQLADEPAVALRKHMKENVDDALVLWLDGRPIQRFENHRVIPNGQLKIYPENDSLDLAAEYGVILAHGALPCHVDVGEVTPAE